MHFMVVVQKHLENVLIYNKVNRAIMINKVVLLPKAKTMLYHNLLYMLLEVNRQINKSQHSVLGM